MENAINKFRNNIAVLKFVTIWMRAKAQKAHKNLAILPTNIVGIHTLYVFSWKNKFPYYIIYI